MKEKAIGKFDESLQRLYPESCSSFVQRRPSVREYRGGVTNR